MHKTFPACLLLLTTAASAPPRYDWAHEHLEEQFGATTATAVQDGQNACRARLMAEPPASDWPTAREREALKGCDSETLYYGIGVPTDPVAARKCALIERETEAGPDARAFAGLGDGYFSGTGILAMVYANGTGVPRNLDVAIHMACGIEDAPMATDGRIGALLKRSGDAAPGTPFEICDDATSGMAQGYCADHVDRIAAQARKRRIEALRTTWSEPQRILFAKVYASLSTYVAVAHEMDCFGGTAHAACTIAGASRDEEDFLRRIEALAAGRRPAPRTLDEDQSASPAITPLDLHGLPRDSLPLYRANYAETVAARRMFERDLLAFMHATFPTWTAHDVRVTFRDL